MIIIPKHPAKSLAPTSKFGAYSNATFIKKPCPEKQILAAPAQQAGGHEGDSSFRSSLVETFQGYTRRRSQGGLV